MAFQQRDVIMHRELAPETQGFDGTTEIQGDLWPRPQSTSDGEPRPPGTSYSRPSIWPPPIGSAKGVGGLQCSGSCPRPARWTVQAVSRASCGLPAGRPVSRTASSK